jgi:hypothetical protein
LTHIGNPILTRSWDNVTAGGRLSRQAATHVLRIEVDNEELPVLPHCGRVSRFSGFSEGNSTPVRDSTTLLTTDAEPRQLTVLFSGSSEKMV